MTVLVFVHKVAIEMHWVCRYLLRVWKIARLSTGKINLRSCHYGLHLLGSARLIILCNAAIIIPVTWTRNDLCHCVLLARKLRVLQPVELHHVIDSQAHSPIVVLRC